MPDAVAPGGDLSTPRRRRRGGKRRLYRAVRDGGSFGAPPFVSQEPAARARTHQRECLVASFRKEPLLQSSAAMPMLQTLLFSTEDKAWAGFTARVPRVVKGPPWQGEALRLPRCIPIRTGGVRRPHVPPAEGGRTLRVPPSCTSPYRAGHSRPCTLDPPQPLVSASCASVPSRNMRPQAGGPRPLDPCVRAFRRPDTHAQPCAGWTRAKVLGPGAGVRRSLPWSFGGQAITRSVFYPPTKGALYERLSRR
jgi:hypothetical protein